MKHTHYKIGVVTNMQGQSMRDLHRTADEYGVVFDQISFPHVLLSSFHSSALLEQICTYDVVYYRTGMQGPLVAELAFILDARGIPMVNGGPKHIYQHQKIRQTLLADRYRIPQPKTVYVRDFNYELIAEQLGPTFVVKPDEGSKGAGVALIHNSDELNQYKDETTKKRHLYQEFISDSDEYRVYTVGGRGIATYKKTRGENDFRANLHAGGGVVTAEPDRIEKLLAFGGYISRSFGADISGVDILVRGDEYLFLELNWQPGWEQLDELTGVDFCKATLQHLLDRAHAGRPWWRRKW